MNAYVDNDWKIASENLGSSLHLQLYPYVENGQAMRAWHKHVASNDVDALTMRLWIGRLLLIYGKTQLGRAKHYNDLHAADMCYLSANAAVGILHRVKKVDPKRPMSEEALRILFPGEAAETIGNVDDALGLRNECARTLVDIARQGDETSVYHALYPRGVTFNPTRNIGDLLHQLQKVLHTPIKVFSDSCRGPAKRLFCSANRLDNGFGDDVDDSDDPQDEIKFSIAVQLDLVRMNKEEKKLLKMKPIKALHQAAIVAAHGNRDWFRKEVGIDCWDTLLNVPDMRKCREAVEMLWTTQWKKDVETEIKPTPTSLMKALHLVQLATWQSNQILHGTSIGMKHAIGEIFLSNTGFQWAFMDYFYKERLQDGNGDETIIRVIQQALPSRPAVGTLPNSLPVPCLDFSLLQNSLLLLNEVALRDLSIALKGLEVAQARVGGPEVFWPLVQLHNGAFVIDQNSNGDTTENRPANQTLTPLEFHKIVAAVIAEATSNQHSLNNAANNNHNNNAGHFSSSSSSSKVRSNKAAKSLRDEKEELWSNGALSVFGQGLGIPPRKPISMHQRVGKALTVLFIISFEDVILVVVMVLCLTCVFSLYRGVFHMFRWGMKSNRALKMKSGGSSGRSTPSHSAYVISQRNTAATGLREAIASESIPRLTAAVKQAEEVGVEKPLVKKGKDRLHHLKKRKAAAAAAAAVGTGAAGNGLSSIATTSISGGSASAPKALPKSATGAGENRNNAALSSLSSASTEMASMRLLTKGQHTPVNSGDQASADWSKEDEWVVVSPKTQHHHGNHQQQQQEQGNQISSPPVVEENEISQGLATAETLESKKDAAAAATPRTPVRQPLLPSSQFEERASEKTQQSVLSSQEERQQQQAQQQRGSIAQFSSSASSGSSLSTTSTSETESHSYPPELRQARSLPSSGIAVGRPPSSNSRAAAAAVVANPAPRCASAPSREAGTLQGVCAEKHEMVQGKKAPNIVLVKRSSLQHRESHGAGEVAGQKSTPVHKTPASKTSPLNAKTASFTSSTSAGAPPQQQQQQQQQQLPVLTFHAPVDISPNPHAASFEPNMHGSAAHLPSTGRSSISTTVADYEKEARERQIASLRLAQAQSNWSPSANSAEIAAAAYAAAKHSPSSHDDIGYTDAWARVHQHFNNTSPSASHATPNTPSGAALLLSPSFGRATAAGYGALSPSGPFDARNSTGVSTETSLGLSLLPGESSLSGGLSGRSTSSLSGKGELLASLQQIWEVPPSAEGSLTPLHSSQNTTPQATPLSVGGPGASASAPFPSPSPLGELSPSAGLTGSAGLSSVTGQHQAPQWPGIDSSANNTSQDEIYHRDASLNLASGSLSSLRGNHRANSGTLADLGFEESSEV